MGTYNTILASVKRCPRCKIKDVYSYSECKFGDTSQMVDLEIGDLYPWYPRKKLENGGAPPNGTGTFTGYAECQECKKDFWVNVVIDNNRIVSVEVNESLLPYEYDEEIGKYQTCPNCGGIETRLQLTYGYKIAWLICDTG